MDKITIVNSNDVLWEEYRDLRLRALRDEPQAYATSYKDEINTSGQEWQNRLERYQKDKGNWMVFARNGKELVGMVGAYQDEEDKKHKSAHCMALFVSKEYRRKGIAYQLFQQLLNKLRQSGIIKAILYANIEQTAAVALYKKLGFTVVKTENLLGGDGKYHDEYLMEKQLTHGNE